MSGVYYNEIDPFAAAWLRELMTAGALPAGEVDERSIWDVTPDDVRGFTHCHFFAGIGGWAYALQLAGWPDDRPVWTGSCPCQPYSAAGKGLGDRDPRNLWPAWRRLIVECRPDVVAGEQVENAIGHGWLDTVATDLEAEGYAVGAVVLGAHSVGAPHRRQRLWFVADAQGRRDDGPLLQGQRQDLSRVGSSGEARLLAESHGERREGERLRLLAGEPRQASAEAGRGGEVGDVADTEGVRQRQGRADDARGREGTGTQGAGIGSADDGGSGLGDSDCARESTVGGVPVRPRAECEGNPWGGCDWLPCRDGKLRPVEPGTFPLAHGVPARVGRLRGYGNAIVPHVAAEVLSAYLER